MQVFGAKIKILSREKKAPAASQFSAFCESAHYCRGVHGNLVPVTRQLQPLLAAYNDLRAIAIVWSSGRRRHADDRREQFEAYGDDD
ncbi:hypothetical protein GUJ93_ZPchr0015g6803 [Zizania palustris]|uniref:Uncharacterized protein n=1 Tax=Zizania palustris TaxID=103762 RepID=A0A8J5VVK4_ZIZPA|nr:hypothetical protein GUJ93_ZPchr0015g6803 [Zizania palustris]